MVSIVINLFSEYFLLLRLYVYSLFNPKVPHAFQFGERGYVVLIWGATANWYWLAAIARVLNKHGFKIYVPNEIGRNTQSIPVIAEKVYNYIKAQSLRKVIFVSHSKGGLVAKYILDHFNDEDRIVQSISISAPYHGSVLGYFDIFNITESTPGSQFLRRENTNSKNNSKIVQLYSELDNHVIPRSNLILVGATNIMIDCIGHTRILEDKKTVEEILKYV